MDEITKEIDEVAGKLEKSAIAHAFSRDLIKSTVLRLGAAGLRKALPRLTADQKAMLGEVLGEMASNTVVKSHRDLIANDHAETLEPASNATPSGDYEHNEDEKEEQDDQDEKLAAEAAKRGQASHKNQGGGVEIPGWSGQIIKSQGEFRALLQTLNPEQKIALKAKLSELV